MHGARGACGGRGSQRTLECWSSHSTYSGAGLEPKLGLLSIELEPVEGSRSVPSMAVSNTPAIDSSNSGLDVERPSSSGGEAVD